ncbi:serine/threonine-protein phosphatase 1 regulatory subunit 10 isoform X2 [Sitodiplosis mosellana]|uniref:serine/threonine-protein phosphatase 1 regulatory subunit 10 isoform X2 n=1 Tax=Sitodiplosis mosellana TaxID=263140 RepID=UPI002443A152|nr:serine/threonine-protein phosphatase 1 regulatory subunit 10 isoform X2 [Sitodiplosis mosellana]
MPRIDPVKLLSCIGVLLSPNGGIRSATEVKRLAGLMSKYSKKLVSKCIYIQILKCTETELLGQFMGCGGWPLVHSWLADGIDSKNWPLVQELLELLLLCPVDVPRLQSNSAPKLVKGLSREEENEGVRILATRLVEQWLKIARGEISSQNSIVFNKENLLDPQTQIIVKPVQMFSDQSLDSAGDLNTVDSSLCESQINDNDVTDCANDLGEADESEGLVFKFTMKDGKQTLAKISDTSPKKNGSQRLADTLKDSDSDERSSKSRSDKSKDDKNGKDREKSKDHHKKSSSSSSHRSSSSNKSSSSSSSSKHNSSSSSSKSSSSHSKPHKSSSSSSTSGHKSSSSSSSRDKDRHKSSSKSSSSSGSSSSKDKNSESSKTQAEKDKDTLAKIQPKTLEKLGKIPKKTTSSDGSTDPTKKATTETSVPAKKKSISIEVRKDVENRPKTVKTYNKQFRSHGLAEEAPPPPSRKDLKKPASVLTNGIPIVAKRSLSPINHTVKELEKKIKLSSPTVDKPGAIKLIPAKPKPSVLIESDMFMDAMTAATTKKEVRKRKRITSAKESEIVGDNKTTAPKDSKDAAKAVTAAPLRFYQDTLEESENKEDTKLDAAKRETDGSDDGETKEKKLKTEDDSSEEQTVEQKSVEATIESPEEPVEEVKREPGPGCGPDGPPGVLTIHRRKGPKKTLRWKPQESLEEVRFFELDETERVNVTKTFVDMKQIERVNEREAFKIGRKGIADDVMTEQIAWAPLILVDDVPEHEVKSKEREVQAEREKTCLNTIYFNRAMIPDSPLEPDVIAFQNIEPPTIPLYDITGNTDAIHDYTNMPWPEAKGSPPHQAGNLDDLNGISNFGTFSQFNNMNWPAQNIMGIRPPQIGLMIPPDAINPINMNPIHAFNTPTMAPMMGQLPPNNMAFMNNFAQGMPPMMPDNRANRGNNWFGGNNNVANNNWQAQGPNNNQNNNNNNNNTRQNWVSNRRICKQFQRGFCRHGKNCKFLHPGENGPKF